MQEGGSKHHTKTLHQTVVGPGNIKKTAGAASPRKDNPVVGRQAERTASQGQEWTNITRPCENSKGKEWRIQQRRIEKRRLGSQKNPPLR